MALRKLERRNYVVKSPVSVKYQNLHFFKKRLILLCQSILQTRRITHLHWSGSAHFTIPLRTAGLPFQDAAEKCKHTNSYFLISPTVKPVPKTLLKRDFSIGVFL